MQLGGKPDVALSGSDDLTEQPEALSYGPVLVGLGLQDEGRLVRDLTGQAEADFGSQIIRHHELQLPDRLAQLGMQLIFRRFGRGRVPVDGMDGRQRGIGLDLDLE